VGRNVSERPGAAHGCVGHHAAQAREVSRVTGERRWWPTAPYMAMFGQGIMQAHACYHWVVKERNSRIYPTTPVVSKFARIESSWLQRVCYCKKCPKHASLIWTNCNSDWEWNEPAFQLSQGSVEILFRWDEKRLPDFVANLFRKLCIKFHQNHASFIEDI